MLINSRDLLTLCQGAAQQAGADELTALSLAKATVHAEASGKTSVGLSHFFDYIQALESGAIKGSAEPSISSQGAIVRVDAHHNIPHRGFDAAAEQLYSIAKNFGLGALAISHAFTAGELGYFAYRLAERGLIGLIYSNSPAVVAAGSKKTKSLGTNPHAFGVPLKDRPLIIDQAISQSAFVTIRKAAENNLPLPAGWALNAVGKETTNAVEALEGALLPAGHKLANIGLMVESLAGLAGGKWSIDAPSFEKGPTSPSIGVFIAAINPDFFDTDFIARIDKHCCVLEQDHGVYIPGRNRKLKDKIEISDALYNRLLEFKD